MQGTEVGDTSQCLDRLDHEGHAGCAGNGIHQRFGFIWVADHRKDDFVGTRSKHISDFAGRIGTGAIDAAQNMGPGNGLCRLQIVQVMNADLRVETVLTDSFATRFKIDDEFLKHMVDTMKSEAPEDFRATTT